MSHRQIIITRPIDQANVFAASLQDALGVKVDVTLSPLFEISYVKADIPEGDLYCVTSQNAIKAVADFGWTCQKPIWTVGDKTAELGRDLGYQAVCCGPDVMALENEIKIHAKGQRIVYLRGEVVSTPLGHISNEIIVYRQIPIGLSNQGLALLNREPAVILPLFSARTAAILGNENVDFGRHIAVAISENVAEVCKNKVGFGETITADNPSQSAVIAAIDRYLSRSWD